MYKILNGVFQDQYIMDFQNFKNIVEHNEILTERKKHRWPFIDHLKREELLLCTTKDG